MNEENKNIFVSYWLLLITFFIIIMIAVGGITRLTDSGLSITKWDLFTGILPPLTKDQWEVAFSLYKKIPEFTLLNSSMSLDEFKFIYFWEYIHRLLGRIIGLFYIIPLIFFTFYKLISKKKDILYFYFIFLLICFQGFIGWYMVKSGLSERTDVSHYRLSLHLTFAFFIYILLFVKYLSYRNSPKYISGKMIPYNLSYIFVILILIQISTGALVSGLDAGKIYQTWPLMNSSYFPNDSYFSDLLTIQAFETPSIVQFIHRNLAYFIFIFFLIIYYFIKTNKEFLYLKKTIFIVFLALLFQIFLGILTILSGAQFVLALMHQIGSVVLLSSSLVLLFKNLRVNKS